MRTAGLFLTFCPHLQCPESHLVGVRASSDPNSSSIAHALALSTTAPLGVNLYPLPMVFEFHQ
jgi:hypothetical protein